MTKIKSSQGIVQAPSGHQVNSTQRLFQRQIRIRRRRDAWATFLKTALQE